MKYCDSGGGKVKECPESGHWQKSHYFSRTISLIFLLDKLINNIL